MQGTGGHPAIDNELLKRFNDEIKTKVPHLRSGASSPVVVNATPLADITGPLLECAKVEYGLDLSTKNPIVLAKFDSQIFGGSVKVRPAVLIIEKAITSGELRSGQTIFEATSGNFGLALGMLGKLGLDLIVLVSRKLQEGVLEQLLDDGVKFVNLDMDICPAPGLKVDPSLIIAKSLADNLRAQLVELGLDASALDGARAKIEGLLARQDVIGLAKFLAQVYGGYCPEQYDNDLNVTSHETVTGPEIEQQLKTLGHSLGEFKVVCTFGTGGTSTGISNYVQEKYGRKSVHVVFPLSDQDVGGIRTRDKAFGLKFYRPELYAGQHEVDFESAKPILRFFAKKGYDIGESSALGLYACLQMLNYGVGEKFVVLVADGIQKYTKSVGTVLDTPRYEVSFQEASSTLSDYGEVVWTHSMFVPKEEGIKLIASSLGCEESRVKVARAHDVQTLISTGKVSESLRSLLPEDKRRLLLVCMVGGTSLRVAELLAGVGVEARSLAGGITSVSEANGRQPQDVVRIATD